MGSREVRGRSVRWSDSRPRSGRTPDTEAPKPVCRLRSASLSGTWTRLDPAAGRWGPLDPVAGGESLANGSKPWIEAARFSSPSAALAIAAVMPARSASRPSKLLQLLGDVQAPSMLVATEVAAIGVFTARSQSDAVSAGP